MAKAFEKLPNKTFVPFTPPPLRANVTKPEYGQRAIKFANWMVNEWDKPQNVKVFDFFKLLSDENGYLKKEYCPPFYRDSHPNKTANIKIAPIFVNFLTDSF